jgi:pyrroloquinoline quinone biosynthesis protein E
VIDPPRPYTLVAELTYRCRLRCGYCSNPVEGAGAARPLATGEWIGVLVQAEALGVVQVHFTGGEPLLRTDLEPLLGVARALDLYTQLVTSGVPLTRERLRALRTAGLDCVQLSVQAAQREASDAIAGRASFDHKLEVARWVKELGLPLTLNAVLHRANIDSVAQLIALAEQLGADRLELANAQYLGSALRHRDALLPSRAQLEHARAIATAARERLTGRMEILFVLPDYHAGIPRACMDGWAQRYMVVTPDGTVLPCQAAHALTELHFDNVRQRPLADIWKRSSALNAFRGEEWMKPPCRSCDRRTQDFGGCRCQAFALTGDAAAADPACRLSPDHELVQSARRAAEAGRVGLPVYRVAPPRRSRSAAEAHDGAPPSPAKDSRLP